MTQSRNPPTKPSIPVPRRASENAPAPPHEEIPRGEFIDVLTNKPVEPSRLQVFPVPEEFLNKVHASKPPHLRPDDIKDTVPRGLPQQRPTEPVPPSANAPINSPGERPRSSKAPAANSAARSSSAPPAGNAPRSSTNPTASPARVPTERPRNTVHVRPRPEASTLTRWALTGKIPTRVKLGFAALIGGLFLILLWQHWDGTALSSDTASVDPLPATPGGSVPLIDAPTANIAVAPREMQLQKPAPLSAPVAVNEPAPNIDVHSVNDLPVISDTQNGISQNAKKTQPTRSTVSPAPVDKSIDSAAQVRPVASSNPQTITPLFEPR